MTNTQAKKYFIYETQLRTAVKPAQYYRRFRSERRIGFWRAMIGMCLMFVALFISLVLGFFDPLFRLFVSE